MRYITVASVVVLTMVCLTACMELIEKTDNTSVKINTKLAALRKENNALRRENMRLKLKINSYQRAEPWSEYLQATLSDVQQMKLSVAAERTRQQRLDY